ncbi:MAG TPA: peptide chain release factor N(5)-glutamine methyltransferase [Afipia sp.]|nr:peptide chain release factor N(5)-glutamine methyltransferase [Afipia sp.]
MSASDPFAGLTIEASRRALAAQFKARGIETPELDARLLIGAALDLDHTALAAQAARLITSQESKAIARFAQRRMAHEPVARILGRKEFWSLELELNASTLVPRPETELLVETALEAIPAGTTVEIADLGTGSGAIALALAAERPLARITATDLNPDALWQARDNASRLGLAIHFEEGDWFRPLAGRSFDVIVSNPPYVRDNDPLLQTGPALFEPPLALFGGQDGLTCLRTLCASVKDHLNPGGFVALEHGHDQQDAVKALLSEVNLESIVGHKDLAGRPRVTTARMPH